MNTETGEIRQFSEGQQVPKGWVPLNNLPSKNCPTCKGTGHSKKLIRVKGKYLYEPCPCTI